MILEFTKGVLGPFAYVLDFLLENPVITTTLLLVWLTIYLAGRVQLRQIEQKSRALVLQLSREYLAQQPHLSATGLYQHIYPHWSKAVPGWGRFVPHRLDLWPVPATPENVAQKIAFSPRWIAELLDAQNINLPPDQPHPADRLQL